MVVVVLEFGLFCVEHVQQPRENRSFNMNRRVAVYWSFIGDNTCLKKRRKAYGESSRRSEENFNPNFEDRRRF